LTGGECLLSYADTILNVGTTVDIVASRVAWSSTDANFEIVIRAVSLAVSTWSANAILFAGSLDVTLMIAWFAFVADITFSTTALAVIDRALSAFAGAFLGRASGPASGAGTHIVLIGSAGWDVAVLAVGSSAKLAAVLVGVPLLTIANHAFINKTGGKVVSPGVGNSSNRLAGYAFWGGVG